MKMKLTSPAMMTTLQQNDASVNIIIQNIKRRDIILQEKFT